MPKESEDKTKEKLPEPNAGGGGGPVKLPDINKDLKR